MSKFFLVGTVEKRGKLMGLFREDGRFIAAVCDRHSYPLTAREYKLSWSSVDRLVRLLKGE
jgi:hypothetical protein